MSDSPKSLLDRFDARVTVAVARSITIIGIPLIGLFLSWIGVELLDHRERISMLETVQPMLQQAINLRVQSLEEGSRRISDAITQLAQTNALLQQAQSEQGHRIEQLERKQ